MDLSESRCTRYIRKNARAEKVRAGAAQNSATKCRSAVVPYTSTLLHPVFRTCGPSDHQVPHAAIGNRRYDVWKPAGTKILRGTLAFDRPIRPQIHADSADEPNPGLERTRHQLRASGAKPQRPTAPLRHSQAALLSRQGASYLSISGQSPPKEVLLDFEREKAECVQLDFAGRGEPPMTSRRQNCVL